MTRNAIFSNARRGIRRPVVPVHSAGWGYGLARNRQLGQIWLKIAGHLAHVG